MTLLNLFPLDENFIRSIAIEEVPFRHEGKMVVHFASNDYLNFRRSADLVMETNGYRLFFKALSDPTIRLKESNSSNLEEIIHEAICESQSEFGSPTHHVLVGDCLHVFSKDDFLKFLSIDRENLKFHAAIVCLEPRKVRKIRLRMNDMKWICPYCKSINPQFSYKCHGCNHERTQRDELRSIESLTLRDLSARRIDLGLNKNSRRTGRRR